LALGYFSMAYGRLSPPASKMFRRYCIAE